MKTVHVHVWNPADTHFFKFHANDPATCETITCSIDGDCPLARAGTCAKVPVLFSGECPYGRYIKEKGPTKRASSVHQWVKDRMDRNADVPYLKSPVHKMAFIGTYVYLPYAHMNMNTNIPFLSHGQIFNTGSNFIPKQEWTIETVLKIVMFKPQALMGGEITTYQKDVIPIFVSHLNECDKDMFNALIKAMPELYKAPNYVGRLAYINSLNYPLTWTAGVNEKYPVVWSWDGKVLKTNSQDAYSKTWGGSIPAESLELTIIPKPEATVKVQDNSWVNENTKYKD